MKSHLTSADLTTLRQHTNWRQLFSALQIQKDETKSREDDWWGKSPFKPNERTASFHLNDRGWYCHATGQGGGSIELVQRLHPGMTCYEAGRWLLEHGVSRIVAEVRSDVQAAMTPPQPADEQVVENQPIRQDLRPRLSADHPAFTARDIPPEVLTELGIGYLERPPRKGGRRDPMNRRLVFQIRGVWEDDGGQPQPVIFGHIGRATTPEQVEQDGKWWTYAGFRKSLELYNLDRALLDAGAVEQAQAIGHLILVEGCFDVAKLYAAGIRNVVATFGAHLHCEQLSRLDLLSDQLGVDRFLIWYDRDQDGIPPHGLGALEAQQLITARGFEVEVFDWQRSFSSPRRSAIPIPPSITDPCEFSVEQLQWLRQQGII